MGKRFRTSYRFEAGYDIAVASCQQGWTLAQRLAAIERGLADNEDLIQENSLQQALREWQRWCDPKLCGFHARIRDYARRMKATEPSGSRERELHIFDRVCKAALEDPAGVAAALRAIGA
jgi:hypothetical protein